MPLRAHYEPHGPIRMQFPCGSSNPPSTLKTRLPRPDFQCNLSGTIERHKEAACLQTLLRLDRLDVIHAGDRTFALASSEWALDPHISMCYTLCRKELKMATNLALDDHLIETARAAGGRRRASTRGRASRRC
jgi:hypothetical protein